MTHCQCWEAKWAKALEACTRAGALGIGAWSIGALGSPLFPVLCLENGGCPCPRSPHSTRPRPTPTTRPRPQWSPGLAGAGGRSAAGAAPQALVSRAPLHAVGCGLWAVGDPIRETRGPVLRLGKGCNQPVRPPICEMSDLAGGGFACNFTPGLDTGTPGLAVAGTVPVPRRACTPRQAHCKHAAKQQASWPASQPTHPDLAPVSSLSPNQPGQRSQDRHRSLSSIHPSAPFRESTCGNPTTADADEEVESGNWEACVRAVQSVPRTPGPTFH